jgi:serine/threonine protein kinase
MENLFKADVSNWSDWGRVYQSVEAFEPLIKHICEKEKIPYGKTEHCTPGTNAVFKVITSDERTLVFKIFAPKESGMDTDSDYNTELFGMSRAKRLGVSVPELIAYGDISDKYLFRYMVMEYIDGAAIGDVERGMTDAQKFDFAYKLRQITDKLNTPSERFNSCDIIERARKNKRWSGFPEKFNRERLDFLKRYKLQNEVYVHGDLNPDNILIGSDEKLYIIDFADAMIAPVEYEWAVVTCELFCFEKPYIKGFFGNISEDELTEICFNGLLIHDFGAEIIKVNLGDPSRIEDLNVLREHLYKSFCMGEAIGGNYG